MSENTEKLANVTSEDCENLLKYVEKFEIEISESLKKAVDQVNSDNSQENILNLKIELSKWMLESDHESFQDSLWDMPKEVAKEFLNDLEGDNRSENE